MDLYILYLSFFSFSFYAYYGYYIEEWTETPKIKRLPLLLSFVLSGPIYRIASYTCDCAWDELLQIIIPRDMSVVMRVLFHANVNAISEGNAMS